MRLSSRLSTSSLKLALPRRGGAGATGLDIQPGFAAAVEARVNGSLLADRAAVVPLAADAMRDGEVADEAALADALRELFAYSGLGKRVRIGVANQRTVLRTLELPPVTDHKELSAAVQFQAQDQVPMPLSNAVLDFHPLGIVDTPAGPRQRVVLVAAQRDMVERLVATVRRAGLIPAGIDLSAFALIRSLYRHEPEQTGRVLYLNVDGLTNLAIAEGRVCRFTRVVGSGLEGMAAEVAQRGQIPIDQARLLVQQVDLTAPPVPPAPAKRGRKADAHEPAAEQADAVAPGEVLEEDATAAEAAPAPAPAEDALADDPVEAVEEDQPADHGVDPDVWNIVESGIREISGEVRNSLDFHRSQDGGGEVAQVVLSGRAEQIPGFADSLSTALGVEVVTRTVGLGDERLAETISAHRLAVATGLATTETPQ